MPGLGESRSWCRVESCQIKAFQRTPFDRSLSSRNEDWLLTDSESVWRRAETFRRSADSEIGRWKQPRRGRWATPTAGKRWRANHNGGGTPSLASGVARRQGSRSHFRPPKRLSTRGSSRATIRGPRMDDQCTGPATCGDGPPAVPELRRSVSPAGVSSVVDRYFEPGAGRIGCARYFHRRKDSAGRPSFVYGRR